MVHVESADNGEFQDPLKNYDPKVYHDPLEKALAEGKVADIELKPFVEIEPEASVLRALQVLSGLKTASLLVVDKGHLVGVFTERDALEQVAERYDQVKDTPVSNVMTASPVVVYETDPPATALNAIAIAGYRHVPVLDVHEQVVGMISPRRVFSYIEQRCCQRESGQ